MSHRRELTTCIAPLRSAGYNKCEKERETLKAYQLEVARRASSGERL